MTNFFFRTPDSKADAFPLARNPMANSLEGTVLRGDHCRHARLDPALGDVELPAQPKSASFFTVIGQESKGKGDSPKPRL